MRGTIRAAAAGVAAMAAAAAPAVAGTIAFTGTIANSNPGSVLGAPPCGPTEGLVRIGDGVAGVGVADGLSNIGGFEPVMHYCIGGPLPGVVPPTRPVSQGQFAWDFGGGDVLRGTFAGSVIGGPPVLNLLATFTVDGGEGRFRHATGSIAADADVRPGPLFNLDWRLDGTIDTPAPGALALFGMGLAGLAAGRAGPTARGKRMPPPCPRRARGRRGRP